MGIARAVSKLITRVVLIGVRPVSARPSKKQVREQAQAKFEERIKRR